jgi:hypothetical protein
VSEYIVYNENIAGQIDIMYVKILMIITVDFKTEK